MVGVPLIRLCRALNQDVSTAEAKLLRGLRMIHRKDAINGDYERLSPIHLGKGNDEEMLSSLLRSIESLARSSGVTITDIKPRPGQDAPRHRQYLIEMDAEAPMSALFSFIQSLENSAELYTVQKLNVSPKGRESKTLRAYFLVSRTVWI